MQPNSGFVDQLALYGRCHCNLEANPTAVESWQTGRNSAWEGRVDKRRREQKKGQSSWTKGWRKVEKWGAEFRSLGGTLVIERSAHGVLVVLFFHLLICPVLFFFFALNSHLHTCYIYCTASRQITATRLNPLFFGQFFPSSCPSVSWTNRST